MMMALKMDEAAKDMAGAYDFLKAHPACTGKVGSVGFCMGGGLSLMIASIRPIDACVDYYGVADAAQLSGLKAPVLGHYAANDTWASPEAAAKLEKGLRDLGKRVEFHMYPGADHAFFNDSRPEIYNDAAAKLSWTARSPSSSSTWLDRWRKNGAAMAFSSARTPRCSTSRSCIDGFRSRRTGWPASRSTSCGAPRRLRSISACTRPAASRRPGSRVSLPTTPRSPTSATSRAR
jgi:acetyl esterase/lipase